MAQKILNKNSIILPKEVIKHVGIKSGDFVQVTDDGYHIILTPVLEEFTAEEWKKIKTLNNLKGKEYKTIKNVKSHLSKLKK